MKFDTNLDCVFIEKTLAVPFVAFIHPKIGRPRPPWPGAWSLDGFLYGLSDIRLLQVLLFELQQAEEGEINGNREGQDFEGDGDDKNGLLLVRKTSSLARYDN